MSVLPAEAPVLAHRDAPGDAQKRAQEAVDLVGDTEFFWALGDAFVILGEVRRLAGDRAAARTAYRRALATYEAKGILPLMERTRAQLALVEHR